MKWLKASRKCLRTGRPCASNARTDPIQVLRDSVRNRLSSADVFARQPKGPSQRLKVHLRNGPFVPQLRFVPERRVEDPPGAVHLGPRDREVAVGPVDEWTREIELAGIEVC